MSGKFIFVSSLVFILMLVGMVFLFTSGQKPAQQTLGQKIETYTPESTEKPKAEAPVNFIDMGDMSVNDIKSADFTLKNSGNKPLQIIGATTSCHCTNVQIIYKDLKTEEFGMSTQAGYIADIAPGDTATVRVIYKPYIMPVYGFVEREAYLSTNDPLNQKLIFSIKMNVQ